MFVRIVGGRSGGRILMVATILAAVLLSAASLFAAQSVVLSPGVTGSYTVPSRAPFTTLGSFRIEFRVHGWSQASETSRLMSVPFFDIRFVAGSDTIGVTDWVDSFTSGQGSLIRLGISGRSDFFVRFQRDTVARRLIMEIWDADGSNYGISTLNMDGVGPGAIVGTESFGGPQTNARLAFSRWYSGTVPTGGRPVSTGLGDLGNWEFEGNGGDTSGNDLEINFGGSIAYAATPQYPPACDAGLPQAFRAGFPARLDGSRSFAFTGDGLLTYVWQQVREPNPPAIFWSGQSTAQPTVSGLVFGTYKFQLTVTDSSGASSQCSVAHGAVATDDNGVVRVADPRIAKLLGPLMRWGASPWPWFDDRHKAFADFFGGLQSSEYLDYWNTAQVGTVSIAHDGTAVIGSGTNLQTLFCDGGSTTNGKFIVVWYVVGAGTGRHSYSVASCTDETHITLGGGTWGTFEETAQTGVQFSTETEAQRGTWIGGSTNVNYYDNVMAFYSLYYRTGLTVYRDYARTLADRWWTHPNMDEGRTVGQSRTVVPRLTGFTGLVARALDGRPEMWDGLLAIAANDVSGQSGTGEIYDIRESGYSLSHLALVALLHPDSGTRATYVGHLETALTDLWGTNQQANGQWRNYSWGIGPPNGYPGTATVTHGSATVVGVDTTWGATFCTGNAFWIAYTLGASVPDGDPVAYTCARVSNTEITLDRPYEGTSASGRGWEFNNLVGWGTQPFMMGIVGTAMNWSYEALHAGGSKLAPTVKNYVLDGAAWLTNYGYSPTTRGLYYGRDFANCEPISPSTPNCGSENNAAGRFLNGEAMNVFSAAYLLSGNAAYKTQGDQMFSAMWAHSEGEIGYDGIDLGAELDYALSVKKAKDFGFVWGIGLGSAWPAARLGSSQYVPDRTVTIAFDLASVPRTAEVRLTLTKPDGTTAQVTCSTAPCAVHADPTKGDCLVELRYLSAEGAVLATGRRILLHVGA